MELRDISRRLTGRFAETRPLSPSWAQVTLFHDSDDAIEAMLRGIAQASDEVLLEMYWFASDTTGWRFAKALAEKAKSGTRVCLLFDAIGSWDSDEAVFDFMRQAGCELAEYHPIAPWRRRFRLDKVNRRDHRKILVLDQKTAFTGGVNLADAWLRYEHGGSEWRDDTVCVQGSAVQHLRSVMADTWNKFSETTIVSHTPAEVQGAPSVNQSKVLVLANFFKGSGFGIRRAYLQQIRHAQKSILIANAYFVPGKTVSRELIRAAKRGVDVRVLLPEQSDVLAVYYASRRMFSRFMKHGVRIYAWPHSVLHSKSAVIDRVWTTIGTHNLDNRSIRMNLEVNVAIEDEKIGQAMHEKILSDMEKADAICRRDWRFRPLGMRVAERFFYALRWLL